MEDDRDPFDRSVIFVLFSGMGLEPLRRLEVELGSHSRGRNLVLGSSILNHDTGREIPGAKKGLFGVGTARGRERVFS